jgi:hypothetical protein
MKLFRLAVSKDDEVLSLEEDTEGGYEEVLCGPFDKRFRSPEGIHRAVYLEAPDELGAFKRWRERSDKIRNDNRWG